MNRHTFAKWGVAILFPPNAALTAIFFFLLLGNLSAIFGYDYGFLISIIISLMLGVGLVMGETVAHLTNAENNEHSIGIYLILIMLAATNWGAGVYRSADNAREQSVAAISEKAKDDKRYQSLQSEKDHLEKNVLNDGFVGNDAKAMDRMKEINTEMAEIENNYATKSSLLMAGGRWNMIISLAFIVINLVYGLCVKAAYEGPSVPTKTKKKSIDKTYDATKYINNDHDVSAIPTTAENKEKTYGFTPPKEPEKKMPVDISTYSANGSAERKNKKEIRKQKLINFIQTNPDATIDQMCTASEIRSRSTVYKYLKELNIK